ncbi:MAG TPA: hypothetical protein VJT73_22165 [Polyangiaceae bacterium]|nr:hypothetical protein [Polyangiaceae bacterium]
MTPNAGKRMTLVAQRLPFRLAVAAAFVLAHFGVVMSFAFNRYGLPFNLNPQHPPAFIEPTEPAANHWDRLAVSRWDSAHYISLVLRGYSQCPKQDEPRLPAVGQCNLNFYPGYPALGWIASSVTHLPADYALLALSIVASFALLFLWTDRVMVERLGVATTYASLLAFNAFPTAFALVTLQTEPCALAFTLGAFLAFARRRLWLAALLAGAASGMRVSGAATSVALGLAILWQLYIDSPKSWSRWISPLLASVASAWGLIFIMGYHYWRYRDPLLYVHAHAQTYAHSASLSALFNPDTRWLLRSVDHPLHEGVVLTFSLMWFLLGRKQAMAGFTAPERVFWYALSAIGVFISVLGTIDLGLTGMNRYLLLIFPVFFAIGGFLRRRPLVFAIWLVVSFWHYRNVDLCDYLGGVGDGRFPRCYVNQWVGHW